VRVRRVSVRFVGMRGMSVYRVGVRAVAVTPLAEGTVVAKAVTHLAAAKRLAGGVPVYGTAIGFGSSGAAIRVV
jgi:hypothetical protein